MQDYIVVPLDDADAATIELARRAAGHDLTEHQFMAMRIELFCDREDINPSTENLN